MRVVTVLIAVFLFLVSSSLGQTQRENPTNAIRTALGNRDFDKVVELTRTALRESPNNAQLWTFQGIALAEKGDNPRAFVSFKHALKIDPNNPGALAGAAQSAYATNNSAEAVPLLNRFLRLRPDEPTAHAMLAVLQYREGNCSSAATHFEKADELIGSQLDALNAYGAWGRGFETPTFNELAYRAGGQTGLNFALQMRNRFSPGHELDVHGCKCRLQFLACSEAYAVPGVPVDRDTSTLGPLVTKVVDLFGQELVGGGVVGLSAESEAATH